MTIKITPFNPDDIIRLRKTGIAVNQIAKELSVPIFRVRLVLKDVNLLGLSFVKRHADTMEDSIVSLFNSGKSVKAIAGILNITRGSVSLRLKRNGITGRDRSESMYLRMSQISFQDKQTLTQKANKAIRSMPKEFHHASAIKQALSKATNLSKVGDKELFVFEQLKINGFNPIQQAPIDAYNIDVLCGSTVIEIHKEACHPHLRELYAKRIKYLLKSGFNVIYVKWSKATDVDSRAIDKLVTFIKFSSVNPSYRGKYWVIRGTGETLFSGCMDGDNLSAIRTTNDIFNSTHLL